MDTVAAELSTLHTAPSEGTGVGLIPLVHITAHMQNIMVGDERLELPTSSV